MEVASAGVALGRIDQVRDTIQETAQSYLCEEVPKLIRSRWFFRRCCRRIVRERARKAHALFELDNARVRKVHLGEEIRLDHQGVPVHALAQFSQLRRNALL